MAGNPRISQNGLPRFDVLKQRVEQENNFKFYFSTMMKYHFWIVLIFVCSHAAFGQNAVKIRREETGDILKAETEIGLKTEADSQKVFKKKFIPNPKRAAQLAAILPGSGQIYNRDYWKAPLVFAALAGGTWTAIYWHVRYQDFVQAYKSFYDLVPSSETYGQLKASLATDPYLPVFYRGGILNGKRDDAKPMTIDQVKKAKDTYRRYFQTAVVVTVALYAVSIIEANVAAHMKTFDLSDDLTLRVEPRISQPMVSQPVPGVRLVFTLK